MRLFARHTHNNNSHPLENRTRCSLCAGRVVRLLPAERTTLRHGRNRRRIVVIARGSVNTVRLAIAAVRAHVFCGDTVYCITTRAKPFNRDRNGRPLQFLNSDCTVGDRAHSKPRRDFRTSIIITQTHNFGRGTLFRSVPLYM